MSKLKVIGNFGEDVAEKYLKKRGWRILSRNFLAHGGEIDIIGYRFGVLVYFEVKTRSNEDFGKPRDSVDAEKTENIKIAAREFSRLYISGKKVPVYYGLGIEKRRRIYKQRIDVIEIYLNDKSTEINHIKNWGSRL